MQVKAISGLGRLGPLMGGVPAFLADGEDITSVTVVEGSPSVSVMVPVSLALLEAACWNDLQESAGSVAAMSDDDIRWWAVTMLLASGIVPSAVASNGFSPTPASAESARYLAVIRQRLPQAFGLVSRELSGSAA